MAAVETVKIQAIRTHLAHVVADGQDGHTATDEWRNCQHVECAAFRESISGRPRVLRAVKE